MHFEILVEDKSGKTMLDQLFPKLLGDVHTFNVHAYKGIGRIPKDMKDTKNAKHRILLTNLPKLLKGYGRSFCGYGSFYPAAVIVVCDLDDRCLKSFTKELYDLLKKCNPQPQTRFCIAIEEGEAWLLGDIDAITQAYPSARLDVLNRYTNDSICGTWETLADAIYSGGAESLRKKGWQSIGTEKATWAKNIPPFMVIEKNRSPSFQYLKKELAELINESVST